MEDANGAGIQGIRSITSKKVIGKIGNSSLVSQVNIALIGGFGSGRLRAGASPRGSGVGGKSRVVHLPAQLNATPELRSCVAGREHFPIYTDTVDVEDGNLRCAIGGFPFLEQAPVGPHDRSVTLHIPLPKILLYCHSC